MLLKKYKRKKRQLVTMARNLKVLCPEVVSVLPKDVTELSDIGDSLHESPMISKLHHF